LPSWGKDRRVDADFGRDCGGAAAANSRLHAWVEAAQEQGLA